MNHPPSSQSLVWTHTPLALAVAVVFVLAVAVLGLLAWQRSGFRRVTGLLEALRLLIAVFIAVTLFQPEWREVFKPDFKPTLTILVDDSHSMDTRDIIDPAHPGDEPRSRAETARPLTDLAAWKEIAQRMDVVVEPFSSTQTPPQEATDLNEALARTAEKYPHLNAIVLLSDGDWNAGDPPAQAAMRLRMRDVPVFAVPLGSETRLPDVAVTSFDVPTFAVAGKPLRVPFTIESSLPRDEAATLELRTSNGEIITKDVVIPAMSRLQDVISMRPDRPGELKLKLTVPRTGGERFLDNNSMEATLSVRKEQLRVLVIDSFPRWEFRYLRNALERDPGVEVNCLLFQPDVGAVGAGRGYLPAFPRDDALAKYDVVFLGDVGVAPGQLTTEQCGALQKLVRDQAAGLVFLPGLRGFESTLESTPFVRPAASRLGRVAAARVRHVDPRKLRVDRGRRAQPAHEAGGHRRGQRAGLADAAGIPMVRPRHPGKGRDGNPRHPRHRDQPLRADPAHRHQNLRGGQNPVHGYRRGLALAQRRRG